MQKNILIALFLLVALPLRLLAQDPAYPPAPTTVLNIIVGEFFVDTDPGFGNGTAISFTAGTDISSILASIPTAALSVGVHRLYLRTLNAEGEWSITSVKNFVIDFDPAYPVATAAGNVIKAEQFVDTDPGFGNGNNIAVSAGLDLPNQNVAINSTGLSQGTHRVYIRTLNAEGEWSVTSVRSFVVNEDPYYPTVPAAPGNITRVEYFIDTDPGFGNGISIAITPAVNISDLIFAANINGLPGGIHRLYIRSLDDWSITSVREFEVIAPTPKVILSGAITGDFQTLKESFDAINAGGGSGNVLATIVDNTTETTQAVLNQTNYTVQVVPQGNRIIEGNLATALVVLNGADNVTINGQSLAGANTLTFRNINTGAEANVIRLQDAAQFNVIKKCIIEGSSNSNFLNSGALVINVTTLGNGLFNIIDSNLVRPSTAAGLNYGIVLSRQFTSSTSIINLTQITNNQVENVFINNAAINNGIVLGQNSTNTLIKGNSIYNTLTYTNSTNGAQYSPINVSSTGTTLGSGTTIDSNFVGGSASGASGSKMIISSPNHSLNFTGIFLNENINGGNAVVKNNLIRNMDIEVANPTSTAASPFIGIRAFSAKLQQFENNTLGDIANNSISILVKPGSTGTVNCFGHLIQTTCGNPIANNFAGGINLTVTPVAGSLVVPSLSLLDNRSVANANIKKNIIGSASPGNITITNNSPSLFTLNVLGNGFPANISNIKVDSNTVRNITANNVSFGGVQHSNSTTTATTSNVTMNGNTIENIALSGTSVIANGLFYNVSSGVNSLTHTLEMRGNQVSNITAASGSGISLRGIRIINASTATNRIKGRISENTVTNINNSGSGTGGFSRGITFSNDIVVGDSMVIASNLVNGVSDGGASISTDHVANSNGIIVSMENSGTNGTAVVRDNIVHGIAATNTSNAATSVHGISIFGNRTIVERNKVYAIQNAATAASARLELLSLRSRIDDANTSLIRNNMLAVNTATEAQMVGIRLTDAAVKSTIYHNSIVTEGTSAANSFVLLKDATAVADVKNNILYNAVTGAGNAFAIGLQTDAIGYTGNNNYFVSPVTATLAQVGAASHNLAGWQIATSQDGAAQEGQTAVTTNASNLFLNKAVANLLINTANTTEPAKASDKGLAISASVPEDFLGLPRSATTPDIGAQEFVFSGALPLNLMSFSGSKQNQNALLQWRTANEVNVSRFELQRSDDGQNFATIGTIQPGNTSYAYTDVNIFNSKAVVFYRLKSIDIDDKFSYSAIIKLSSRTELLLTVYPNPVKDVLTIGGLQQNGVVRLFNAAGKLLLQQTVAAQTTTMDMNRYANGMYVLQYQVNGEVMSRKIIKQ